MTPPALNDTPNLTLHSMLEETKSNWGEWSPQLILQLLLTVLIFTDPQMVKMLFA